ncbi:MAG: hypothetical protein R3F56_16705 [Planctomycetota bacterium]
MAPSTPAAAVHAYGDILIVAGRFDEAVAECRKLVALCEGMARDDAAQVRQRDWRVHALHNIGWAIQEQAEAVARTGGAPDTDSLREARETLRGRIPDAGKR